MPVILPLLLLAAILCGCSPDETAAERSPPDRPSETTHTEPPPPEIDPNDEYAQNNDPRYTGDPVPEAECLADVVKRVEPYFKSDIEPELKAGKTVLIAAHGNSLRAIVKMLDNLSEEEIAKVNIPTAMPLLYELDENFKPIKPRGEYLDPEAAAAGAAAVAAQGQK